MSTQRSTSSDDVTAWCWASLFDHKHTWPYANFLASVIACLTAWQLWRLFSRRLKYDLHKIPGPKPWPVVGNLPDILGAKGLHLHKTLADWGQQYGSLYKFELGPQTMLVVSDPVEVARICSNTNRQANLDKWHPFYSAVETRAPHYSLFGTPDYEQWKHYRKIMNPAFSPDNIRKSFPTLYEHVLQAANVLDNLRKQGPVDIKDVSSRLTAGVIHSSAFEDDLHALDMTKLSDGTVGLSEIPYLQLARAILEKSIETFTNPFYSILLALCPWLPDARQLKANIELTRQKDDSLAQLIRQRGAQPTSNTSIWACLGRLTDHKTGAPIAAEALAINIALFFLAGYETTAHTITWALFELAAQPRLQDEVREELKAAGYVPSSDQTPTKQIEHPDLGRLPFLEAVIKETLRLHPTAPLGSFRKANEGMVVGGYRIPKGTPINMPPYVAHVAHSNFEQPYRFWPERWKQTDASKGADNGGPQATPAGNSRDLAHSFNPFSCGPRNCIGQSLAMMELRTALMVLVSRFCFALPAGLDPAKFVAEEAVWMVTLQPRHGLPLVVTPVSEL